MLGKFGMLDMDDMDEVADMDDLALKDLQEEQVKVEEAVTSYSKGINKFKSSLKALPRCEISFLISG